MLISGDSHLEIPPNMWIDYVPEEFREFAPRVVTVNGKEAVQVPGNWPLPKQVLGNWPIYTSTNVGSEKVKLIGTSYWDEDGTPSPGTGDPARRLTEQDRDGVSAEVLYPPLFMYRSIEAITERDVYLAMVTAYNDFLADYCAYSPTRLIGGAVLPSTGVDDVLAELKRIDALGLPAVTIRWFPTVKSMPHPDDDSVWKELLDLGIPITCHTALGGQLYRPSRIRMGDLPPAPSPPMEVGLSVRGISNIPFIFSQLIMFGVLDRFPDLRIYMAEVNAGWLPFALSMMDDSYLLYGDEWGVDLKMLPSEYVLKHFTFGIVRDPVALQMVANGMLPAENIVWGSDFPHAVTSWPNSRAWLDTAMVGISDADRSLITRDNTLAFFGISAPEETLS
jgi:predicted TIM-barrel fold metal-dependent hydrolase